MNRKLAEGGMAEIFLAKQHGSQGFEKPVVLKRIHAALYADEQFRNMLIDEAHISMGLMHNNIVQVLDLGQAGGRYFLVLELIEGWDLGRIIRRAANAHVPVPPEIGLYIVAQVCRALGYAHSKTNVSGKHLGIVHRDVSPQNVLISEQGDVKLADFGIAKARRSKRESTDTGVVKGKIAFMSPEQAMGQELDARSDLYSLGTLLYLLVTGVRPFEGATDLEILLRVQNGEMTPPLTVMPSMEPAVAAVIDRAMQFDREQRYNSADEMLADIESALRSVFSSPGQTELKHWLAELSRLDGEPPIGKHFLGQPDESLDGIAEVGHDLVLGENVEPTLLHDPPSRKERLARMTGAEATVADLRIGPTWIDQETPVAIRSTAPSKRSSASVMLVMAIVIGASAAGVWKVLKQRKALEASDGLASQNVDSAVGQDRAPAPAAPTKDIVAKEAPRKEAAPEAPRPEPTKEPIQDPAKTAAKETAPLEKPRVAAAPVVPATKPAAPRAEAPVIAPTLALPPPSVGPPPPETVGPDGTLPLPDKAAPPEPVAPVHTEPAPLPVDPAATDHPAEPPAAVPATP
ncbi:MAG: protein kinase [Deltaproteobacteria bacterium]|nr:protein kinase [Deltaproteobacteria bacterium]